MLEAVDVNKTEEVTSIIKKIDDEEQIVWAEVYAPDFPDSQGDFATAETIKKMAYNFMKSGNLHAIDKNHDNKYTGSFIVESFIARKDDKVFIPGAWVVGVHVPDQEIWDEIKKGDINGFSMQALAIKKPVELTIDIPEAILGRTSKNAGHEHKFTVRFDENGKFLGGQTNLVDGHMHTIVKGTVTEKAQGHTHTFSFVEKVALKQNEKA